MSRHEELKRRVARLLVGGTNTGDLSALFLWLRERSYGNRAVADVGDFVAHSDERDKGVAHRGVQRFFSTANFILPRARGRRPPSTLEQLRESTFSAFSQVYPADVKRQTGLSRDKAKKLLTSAFAAMLSYDGDKLTLKRALHPKEWELVRRYTSLLVVRPAFTSQQLVTQLMNSLLKNQLINAMPDPVPPGFAAFVGLYAVERMHLSRITLINGKVAVLQAGIDRDNGIEFIEVHAAAEVEQLGIGDMQVAFPIYCTNLSPREWCEPELLPAHGHVDWNFALEINSAGKLQKL